MIHIKNIKHLTSLFQHGSFHWPKFFECDNVTYKKHTITFENNIPRIIYASDESYLIFEWAKTKTQSYIPNNIHLITRRITETVNTNNDVKSSNINNANQKETNTIGDAVAVTFTSFINNPTLKGKVDTGASICSLHADNIEIIGDKVRFQNKLLSHNIITAPLITKQAIKTADHGVEYRPVIAINIQINDVHIPQIHFNLNDRGHMDYPVLIGQNALEKGKFLIDPTMKEHPTDITTEQHITELEDFDFDLNRSAIADKEHTMHHIMNLLAEHNISIGDIVKYANTEALFKLDNQE